MTPEERARILEAGCDHAEPGTTLVCRECVGAMLAEEREACATVAEAEGAEWDEAYCEQADTYDPGAASNVATGQTARAIAAAIRAR